jgi:hypothetical protein
MVWLLMVYMQRRVLASHTRTVWSLLPLTKRLLGSALCAGSHACTQHSRYSRGGSVQLLLVGFLLVTTA